MGEHQTMPKRDAPPLEADLLQGTLDLLILQTLLLGPPTATPSPTSSSTAPTKSSRSSTARSIQPLHRLQNRGWISSEWGPPENNRKARFYRLTAAGRKQLSPARPTAGTNSLPPVNRVLKPVRE